MHRQLKVAGLAAVGFATLIVLANLVLLPTGPPTTGADPGEAVAYFTAESGAVGLAVALGPLAWALAAIFGAGAVVALGPAERVWALAGFAGLLLQNAAFAVVMALRLALTRNGTASLWSLHDAVFTLNGTFLALAMVGLSVGGRRAGLVRRWHAALGLVAAALQFGSATLAPLVVEHGGALALLGLVGWLLWVVWLVAYGGALVRRGVPEPAAAH